MSPLARVTRALGAVGLLIGFASIAIAIWIFGRVVFYSQHDDVRHLEAKRAYLDGIEAIAESSANARPNILLILFDDLGYEDLGAFGAVGISTPHIDRLAKQGLRLDQYYSPASVCTPARAALLTGRYAPRAGLNRVVFPDGHPISILMKAAGEPVRLPDEEILISEILSAAGYRTGMVGKWHLGDEAPSRPVLRGFDSFFGALYSNDMTPFALYRDDEVEFEAPFDQTQLHARYTEAAIDFLNQKSNAPFFLYYAHNFPHVPLATSRDDAGRSWAGLYGDVVEALDDSVGAILAKLASEGQLENTLILLTSDNGPWYEGSPGRARGRKTQTWEGGVRVPFVAHWPARIEAGRVSAAPVVGVDVVPTLLSLLDLPTPPDRILDGIDLVALLEGEVEPPDRIVYYFGVDARLDAVRDRRFKYHRRRGVRAGDLGDLLSFRVPSGPWIFDLELDPSEAYNVSRRHPLEFARLEGIWREKVAEMDENPRGWR